MIPGDNWDISLDQSNKFNLCDMSPQNAVNLIHKIQLLLEPMGKVDYLITDNYLLFCKDDLPFGKASEDKIYLLNSIGAFKQVDSDILDADDKFLREATESYWIAKNHKLKHYKTLEYNQ